MASDSSASRPFLVSSSFGRDSFTRSGGVNFDFSSACSRDFLQRVCFVSVRWIYADFPVPFFFGEFISLYPLDHMHRFQTLLPPCRGNKETFQENRQVWFNTVRRAESQEISERNEADGVWDIHVGYAINVATTKVDRMSSSTSLTNVPQSSTSSSLEMCCSDLHTLMEFFFFCHFFARTFQRCLMMDV